LEFVGDQVPVGGYVVTDVWWLDQVAAVATSERHFLYARDKATRTQILRLLNESSVPHVTDIWTREEPERAVSDSDPCYRPTQDAMLPERRLVAVHL